MSSQRKILFIRFSSIGDIVLTTPVIRAVKEQTDFEIHAVTKKQNKGLYENNPNISKVFWFEKSVKEIIPVLRNEGYELIIDLQKNLRSANIKRGLKIKCHSFPKLNIDKWVIVNFKINRLPKLHIVDRYFTAVESIGVRNDKKGLEYYIPPQDEIAPELIDVRLKAGYIAVVIGGQHTTKITPPEKVAEIISGLNKPIVLLGGPDDRKRGEQIRSLAHDSIIFNTCGEFNINQSASLVELSDMVITNDTGLMHIAAAFNKYIISLWGNTIPDFGMYPYLPENPDRFVISEVKDLKCRPCSKIGFKQCPKKHFKCMLDQDSDSIIEAAIKFKKD